MLLNLCIPLHPYLAFHPNNNNNKDDKEAATNTKASASPLEYGSWWFPSCPCRPIPHLSPSRVQETDI